MNTKNAEYCRKWRSKNREKAIMSSKNWLVKYNKKHGEGYRNAYSRGYYILNREKFRIWHKLVYSKNKKKKKRDSLIRGRKIRETLDDIYLRSNIVKQAKRMGLKLSNRDISHTLIEINRRVIKALRKIKQIKPT